MASGRPGHDDNLWRDLAASVVQQVADRMRDGARSARRDWDERTGSARRDWADRAGFAGRENDKRADDRHTAHSIGDDIKRLMADSIRAGADAIGDYQAGRDRRGADRDRREAERERRRREAPMRKAQGRAKASKAGAVTMLVATTGLAASGALAAATDNAEVIAPIGVVTLAAGAGAYSLDRRSKRYAAEADAQARRLGAASAAAVDLEGESAYSVTVPSQSSLAYEPTRRLLSQKQALAELLPEIANLAPELAPLARETEAALSGYAERITKLERAQSASGSSALDAPLARAVAQYEEGVDAHQKLVEAAATVLAELSSTEYGEPAPTSLADAADRLQGLAEGLRQVRHDIPVHRAENLPGSAAARYVDDQPNSAAESSVTPARPRPNRRANRSRGLAD